MGGIQAAPGPSSPVSCASASPTSRNICVSRASGYPLGMRSAVLEPDEAGTFVGSTFMYASARDWARLGFLFLHDGQWQGQRLLPEGWVAYSLTPTKDAPHPPD